MPALNTSNSPLFIKRINFLVRRFSTSKLSKEELHKNKHAVRYLEYTPIGKYLLNGNISVPYETLKVMDYNILSHTHMNTHIRNYKKSPRECLNWSYRKSILKEELLEENIDIFCLQEVEGEHKKEFLKPFMEKGYDALYVPRGHGKPDGCALLYQTDRFQLADFKPIHYFQPEVPLLDRPNVGIVARLRLRRMPHVEMVIANTHLLYNQRRTDIKLFQLQVLLAEIDRMARTTNAPPHNYRPVILTGDLNVNAASPLIRLLRHGSVDVHSVESVGGRLPPPANLLNDPMCINQLCQYKHKAVVGNRKNLEKIIKEHRVFQNNQLDDEFVTSPISVNYSTEKQIINKKEERIDHDSNKGFSMDTIVHSFPFINVYDHPQLEYKSNGASKYKKLNVYDYMFYSSDVCDQTSLPPFQLRKGQLQLLSRLRMPTTSEFYSHLGYLPNYACGSDHLPLSATFLLSV